MRRVPSSVLATLLCISVLSSSCGGAKARELEAVGGGKTIFMQAYQDSDAIILLEEVELTYAFDAARFHPYAELRRHRRIQVLTDAGRKRFSRIYVPMNRLHAPRDISARVTHRDGSGDDLFANRTMEADRFPSGDPAASLYNEPAAKVFGVPGMQVGDIVDYQSISVIRDARWVEPLVAGEDTLDLPIQEARLSVVHPPGFDVDFRVTVRGELKEALPERVPARIFDPVRGGDAKLDATRFIWQFEGIPPTFQEPHGATPMAAATQVHVQFKRFTLPEAPAKAFIGYSTWEDVAAWYRELTGKVDGSGASLAGDAKNARTRKEKLKAVQQGCAQLHLLDTDLNLGALRPHKPSEVISAKRGDSKDIAQACLSAARAAGLDAFPVLVARRGHRPRVPDMPTPAAFDHVLIAVPGAGQYDFIDPAGLGVPTGHALPFSHGADGIVVRPDGVDRVTIPEDLAKENVREVSYKLVLTPDAMVEGNASFRLTGQDAAFVRMSMRDLKGPDLFKALAEWLCGGDQKLQWVDAQVAGETPDPDGALRLLVTFGKSPLGGLQGKLGVRFSELVGKPYPFLWRDGRITPVDLGYRVTEHLTATVMMPEGFGAGARPRDHVDENDFVKVEQRHVVADGSVWLRRDRVQKEVLVRPDRYESLKAAYENIWQNLEQSTQIVPGGERGKEYGADPF